MVNRIVLVGRLVDDPEDRAANDGTAISKFRIAVDRTRRGEDGEKQTDFFNVVCFRQSAEFANRYLRKGYLVGVDGRCHIDQYTDREGAKRTWVEVAADSVQNLTPRDAAETDDAPPARQRTEPSRQRESAPAESSRGGRRQSFKRSDDSFSDDDGDPFAEE